MFASLPFTAMSIIEFGVITSAFRSYAFQYVEILLQGASRLTLGQLEETLDRKFCLAKLYVICVLRVLNGRQAQVLPKHVELRVMDADRVGMPLHSWSRADRHSGFPA